MAFLTLLTRVLREKYHPLRLKSCSREDYDRGLVSNQDTTLFTFKVI